MAENCRIAPMELTAAPTHNVLLRPSLSPNKAARRHPTKFPSWEKMISTEQDLWYQEHTEKLLVKIPSMFGFRIWGKVSRNLSLIMMPAIMP